MNINDPINYHHIKSISQFGFERIKAALDPTSPLKTISERLYSLGLGFFELIPVLNFHAFIKDRQNIDRSFHNLSIDSKKNYINEKTEITGNEIKITNAAHDRLDIRREGFFPNGDIKTFSFKKESKGKTKTIIMNYHTYQGSLKGITIRSQRDFQLLLNYLKREKPLLKGTLFLQEAEKLMDYLPSQKELNANLNPSTTLFKEREETVKADLQSIRKPRIANYFKKPEPTVKANLQSIRKPRIANYFKKPEPTVRKHS